ncbi:MAG: hypothetical protein ACFFE3_02105, partial [Candidatus Thorarchaeota archaeon]
MKLIQHSDERSENDLDGGPPKTETDLLVWEDLIESEREKEEKEKLDKIREEKEKLDKIKHKLDRIQDRLDEIKEDSPSLIDSIKIIFSWRNYSVYLSTAWIFSAFSYMGLFFNVYFLTLFPEDYVTLGAIISISNAVAAISRLGGGYVGDVVNRKHLSVIAMFMMAAYNLV